MQRGSLSCPPTKTSSGQARIPVIDGSSARLFGRSTCGWFATTRPQSGIMKICDSTPSPPSTAIDRCSSTRRVICSAASTRCIPTRPSHRWSCFCRITFLCRCISRPTKCQSKFVAQLVILTTRTIPLHRCMTFSFAFRFWAKITPQHMKRREGWRKSGGTGFVGIRQ